MPFNFTQTLTKILQILSTGHRAISHEILTLSTNDAYSLTVPASARYALITAEQVGGSGAASIVRYWEDGSIPTTTDGISRGDFDAWDIYSYSNMKDFKVVRTTANAHKLFIQYYS